MTPTVISDKYEVIGKIGQGGMGTVYKVRHRSLHTILALKLLPDTGNPELVGRFQREARVMARLQHDNIVKVFDITQDRNLYYLVEEFVDGDNLSDYIKNRGPLPLTEALEISHQLADALAYAHSQGVIHRDIKPRNILIEAKRPLRARLIDFGIAKVDDAGDRTQTGTLLGTLKYSAPEQLGYRGPDGKTLVIDGRADIYALGLVIFEMYEGTQFFAGLEQHEIIGRAVYSPEPLVPKFSRQVPEAFFNTVSRAICRDPAERHQCMADLLSAIEECQGAESHDHTLGKPTGGKVSDQELEANIRLLETERQRRSALAAQEKARAAREDAAGAEASEFAALQFRQGLDQQEQADAALREGNFRRAGELFDQAAQLFSHAASEAGATRDLREAEKARSDMLEARREAEREGGPDSARTLYGRGLSLEADAEDFRKRQRYEEAKQAYLDARRFYDQAREQGRAALLRNAAGQARSAVETARAAALEAASEQHAGAELQGAREEEVRAEAAFAADEFALAQELFTAAARAYESAAAAAEVKQREAAEVERTTQQRHAEQAQRNAAAARTSAERAGGPEEAAELFAQAGTQEGQAVSTLHDGNYTQAREHFDAAARSYAQAAAHAENARLAREAEQARNAMLDARHTAEHDGSPDSAPSAYDRAVARQTAADAERERGAHAAAKQLYSEAHGLFQQAIDDARTASQRQAAEAARAQMRTLQAASVQAGAEQLAFSTLQQARDLDTRAESAFARADFTAAEQLFASAGTEYDHARKRTHEERLRQQAAIAHDSARRARVAATEAQAPRRAPRPYQEGVKLLEKGARSFKSQAYEAAIEACQQSIERLQKATTEATSAQQRDTAETARARTLAARREADQTRAAECAAEAYERAHTLEEQATAAAQGGDFARAATLFQDAETLFRESSVAAARTVREVEITRAAAGAAREAADLEKTSDSAPTLYNRAQSAEAGAAECWSRQAYKEARVKYLEAQRLYDEARDAARAAVLRAAAEVARTKMQSAHSAAMEGLAAQLAAAPFREAEQHRAGAERAFAATTFSGARDLFAAAAEAYERATTLAHQERRRQTAGAAQEEARRKRSAATQSRAAHYVPDLYHKAVDLEQTAEQAFAMQAYEQAAQGFRDTAEVFEQAVTAAAEAQQHEMAAAAEAERQQRLTEEVRTQAQAARAAADSADAARLAPDIYASAGAAFTVAEDARRTAQHPQARDQYNQAGTLYTQAAARAAHERLRRAVEDARSAAHEAEQEARQRGGSQYCAALLDAAVARRTAAERARSAQDLTEAHRGFQESATLLRTVAQEALRCAQTEEAQQARAAAHDRQQRVEAPGFLAKRKYRQSVRAAAAGDRHLENQQLVEALLHYQKAVRLLEGLTDKRAAEEPTRVTRNEGPRGRQRSAATDVTVVPARTEAASRRPRMIGVYVTGAVVTVAILIVGGRHLLRSKPVAPPAEPPIVRHQAPAPPVVQPPLAWQQITPAEAETTVKEGERLRFAVGIRQPESYHNLQYVWLVDGHERARGPRWEFEPEADDAAATKEIEVVASDGDERIVHSWHIRVQQANKPPVIEAMSPGDETVALKAGVTQQFSVTASDPDGKRGDKLAYAWKRNGKPVASGPDSSWMLREAQEADTDVEVVVTDSAGASAGERTWKLAVAPPAPTSLPPRVLSETPRDKLVTTDEGASQEFRVRAENLNGKEPLDYAWYLDGREVGHGATWRFTTPPTTSASSAHKVEVEVATASGLKAPRVAWNVEVKAVAPKIVSFGPRLSRVSITEGERKEFSVTAAGRPDDNRLRHEWTIDGQRADAEGNRFQLPTTLVVGAHDVTVAAIDPRGLRSPPQRWTVEVKPKAPKPPAPEPIQLSEADVRNWLARFQDAWQRRDVVALRALGVISGDSEQAALQKVLAGYRELHVSIRNETIHVDGKYATVSFDRTDSDETGKKLSLPRQTYHLEKLPSGALITRPES